MTMATSVISFLGTGQKIQPQDVRSEYRKTIYRFTLPNGGHFDRETSLFGTALVDYLRHIGVEIDRWVVLGTSASLWSELIRVIPDQDAIDEEEYCRIDDRVIARNVDSKSLQKWEQILNEHARPLELRLCLIGEALDPQSQQQIARALFDNVPHGNDVIFDISHGFRHMPVIAAFVISLMRWTHGVKNVRFFSGVFEARQGDITPVIELPICQQLVEATEAAAILKLTGNYAPLARRLGVNAEESWFLENTNQLHTARSKAQSMNKQAKQRTDAVGSELLRLLMERLLWTQQSYYADRVRQSAVEALDHGDYFRAAVLMYEALLIAAAKILNLSGDPLAYDLRQQGETELFNRLGGDARELLTDLQHARNSCAHGSRSSRSRVQHIMQSPEAFRELIRKASELFDRLPELLTS
jgi:cell division protein DivIC